MIRTATSYIARDDSWHKSHDDADRRNKELDRIDAANAVLTSGGSLFDALTAWGYPSPAEIFKRVTADTKLIIPHWQCRDSAGYQPSYFDLQGLWVGGDAGSWSGSYGSYVSIPDLQRYVDGTFKITEAA